MRYPNILFYRHEQYNDVDKILETKKDSLLFNPNIVSSLNNIYKLFDSNYHLLITYGEKEQEYYYLGKVLVNRMFIRWLHFANLNDIDEINRQINHCYINNVIRNRNETRAVFSIFTTTYTNPSFSSHSL